MTRFAFAIMSLFLLPRAWAQTGIAGDWEMTFLQFAPQYLRAHFEVNGEKVTGTIGRFPLAEGRFANGTFEARVDTEGFRAKLSGSLRADELTGQGSDQDGPFTFKARRSAKAPGAPRTHNFSPTAHYNYFASKYE